MFQSSADVKLPAFSSNSASGWNECPVPSSASSRNGSPSHCPSPSPSSSSSDSLWWQSSQVNGMDIVDANEANKFSTYLSAADQKEETLTLPLPPFSAPLESSTSSTCEEKSIVKLPSSRGVARANSSSSSSSGASLCMHRSPTSLRLLPPKFLSFVMPKDHDHCHVCGDADGSKENPIVYCETCNVGVHVTCFGYPLISEVPEDEWICSRCDSMNFGAFCALCPMRYGALKRTTDERWCHLACAQWIPEAFFRLSSGGREPIDLLQIPSRRFGVRCIHCGSSYGACLSCSEEGCQRSFHVTCGMEKNIYLEYKETSGADIIISFCSVHSKKWMNRKATKSVVRAKH